MLGGDGGDLEGVGEVAHCPRDGRAKLVCRYGIDSLKRADHADDLQARLDRGPRQGKPDMTRGARNEQRHFRTSCSSASAIDGSCALQRSRNIR
jgi:hypothetical protein